MARFWDLTTTEGVGLLTLNSPPLNILAQAVIAELGAAADALAQSTEVRALVIAGEGRHFSAGADVGEFAAMSVADIHRYGQVLDWAFRGMAHLPMVTIAAVNGFALGGGCELALTADFRFAGDRATFALPEIQLGLIPGAGGTQRLPRLIGPARAKGMILTGRRVGAQEALRVGLADAVFPAAELLEQALAAAQGYAKGPQVALRAAKQAVDQALGGSLEAGLDLERASFSLLFGTEDWRAGVTSFQENGPGKASFAGR
ncbi:MAG: enoyl-CoA hydratase-related protein [Actinomycetota bacterium]